MLCTDKYSSFVYGIFTIYKGQPVLQPVVQQDCSTTVLGYTKPRVPLLFGVSQHYVLWLESLSQLKRNDDTGERGDRKLVASPPQPS